MRIHVIRRKRKRCPLRIAHRRSYVAISLFVRTLTLLRLRRTIILLLKQHRPLRQLRLLHHRLILSSHNNGCPANQQPTTNNQQPVPQDPNPFNFFFGFSAAAAVSRRCRIASYITIAPATDTFSDDTIPAIGIRSR